MNKHLLTLLAYLCLFSVLHGQSPIFATTNGCDAVPPLSGRFDYHSTINGKYDYVYSEDSRLHIGFNGTKWYLYAGSPGNYTVHGFENTNVTESLLPPENGWVPTNCPSSSTFNVTYSQQTVLVTSISVRGRDGASTVSQNGTLQMEAIITPTNADDKSVTWSVTPGTGSATISSTGVLTGGSLGTVTITARSKDGSDIVGSTQITVVSNTVLVSTISVSSSSSRLNLSSSMQMSANVFPSNATDARITWSVENVTGQATISSSGMLRGTGLGTVRVIATARDGSGITGEKMIEIVEPFTPVAVIAIQGLNGVNSVEVAETLQMEALVLPTDATDKTVVWSVNNGVGAATISTSGLLSAVRVGNVTVRATAADGSRIFGERVITITEPSEILVNNITIRSATGQFSVEEGQSLILSADVLPSNATNSAVSWSVSNETGEATISSAGVLTAVSPGSVLVRCRADDGSGEFATQLVNITAKEVVLVSSIDLIVPNNQTEIEEGSTLQLSVNVLPDNADNKAVSWTVISQGGQATINNSGLLTAISAGDIRLLVESNDIGEANTFKEFTIVEPFVAVSSIEISNPTAIDTAYIGESLRLNASVQPTDATDKSISWSVNPLSGQASISQDGTVIGEEQGIIEVVATSVSNNSIVDRYRLFVKIREVFVSDLTIISANNQSSIIEGSSLQLNASISPENVTNPAVRWRVEPSTLATIDDNGLLQAVAVGTVNIIVEAQDGSNVRDTFVLTIVENTVQVTTLSIAPEKDTMQVGESQQMSATVLPENATNKALEWELINQSGTGNISSTGLITATAEGIIVVRARTTDGSNLSRDVTIFIEPIRLVESIEIQGAVDTLLVGDSLQLSAFVNPQDAEIQEVAWSVSDVNAAFISDAGLVKAQAEGIIWIRATATDTSSVVDSVQVVFVNPAILVNEIKLSDASQATIKIDETLQLSPVILPDSVSNPTVEYTIEAVTGNGIILGNGLFRPSEVGTVFIIGKAVDGSNVSDTLEVIIKDTLVLVSRIDLSGLPDTLYVQDSVVLNANILPADATSNTVDWTILFGRNFADIVGNVFITKKEGVVTIQATAQDASQLIAQHTIRILRNPNLQTFGQLQVTTCGVYESPSTKYVWESSGVYTDTIDNQSGNDSIIQITLNLVDLDTGISKNEATDELMAASAIGTYQWINCSNNSEITGATARTYLPMDPGSYGVRVSLGTCTANTPCRELRTVSNSSSFELEPIVYPNPSSGDVQVLLHQNYTDLTMRLTDMSGRLIDQQEYKHVESLQIQGLSKGFYLLHLRSADAFGTFKLVVR